jgi:hypothetical protein
MFLKEFKKKILPQKSWKNHPQKLLRKTQIHFFSPTASTAQMAQTEEFMFQNVAYRPTVYRTGHIPIELHNHKKTSVVYFYPSQTFKVHLMKTIYFVVWVICKVPCLFDHYPKSSSQSNIP